MFRTIPAIAFSILLAGPAAMAQQGSYLRRAAIEDANVTHSAITSPDGFENDESRRFFVTYKHGMRDAVLATLLEMVNVTAADIPDDDGGVRHLMESTVSVKMLYDFDELDAFVISTASDDEMTTLEFSEGIEYLEEDAVRAFADDDDQPGDEMMLTEDQKLSDILSQNKPGSQHVPRGVQDINAPFMWEKGFRGQGITVCLIDTGINAKHIDFGGLDQLSGFTDPNFTPWDVDLRYHGTAVAGVIASQDNDVGVVGVAPDAKIHTVSLDGTFIKAQQGINSFTSDIIAALRECSNAGARVVNISLGAVGASSRLESRAFRQASIRHNMLVVAASGNTGLSGNAESYPAAYNSVVSVGAVDRNKVIAPFSTYNRQVDLVAPGVSVISPLGPDVYDARAGTSFAAPHVSGAAALLMSVNPRMSALQIRRILLRSAEDLGTQGRDDFYGRGFVDLARAFPFLPRFVLRAVRNFHS